MSNPAVRVVSLQVNNILRLSAVEFKWENGTRVLTLGGKNAAGKSSVLNAIAMALGGMTLCPDEPLKRGESRGFVQLDLCDLVVRREFWRDLLAEQPEQGPPAYGETKSRLVVKNAEGVKQEPAQRLLDKLVGKLTFDPLAFASEDEKPQSEILRRLVGLDFADVNEAHSIAYDKRAVYNREHRDKLVLLDAMTKYDDAPDEEISLSEITSELTKAEALRKKAAACYQAFIAADRHREDCARQLDEDAQRIVELRNALDVARDKHATSTAALEHAGKIVDEARQQEQTALAEVPDVKAINDRITQVEDTNSKVRANTARRAVMAQVVQLQKQMDEQNDELTRVTELKAKKIREAKYPVPGLAISHAGVVTFNGIALKQASTAEQIRVSVAIGFALNPALKLLCVKNGNALDDDSFKLLAECAEAAGGQVLMEIVTKNDSERDSVSVFIEDGHNA
jgi:hypothetical protein